MVDYYPLLIEQCIEFKRFSRAYLANRNCEFYFMTDPVSEELSSFLPEQFNLLVSLTVMYIVENGDSYVENESARTAFLADGYRL